MATCDISTRRCFILLQSFGYSGTPVSCFLCLVCVVHVPRKFIQYSITFVTTRLCVLDEMLYPYTPHCFPFSLRVARDTRSNLALTLPITLFIHQTQQASVRPFPTVSHFTLTVTDGTSLCCILSPAASHYLTGIFLPLE